MTTTAQWLQQTYGPRRRLVCAIDGLQELIWEDDGTGLPPSRTARYSPDVDDVVALLPPDGELGWGVDIGEMSVTPPSLTIPFRNVDSVIDESHTTYSLTAVESQQIDNSGAEYGNTLAMDGTSKLYVGDWAYNGNEGRVFLYERTGTNTWALTRTIANPDGASAKTGFGSGLSADNGTVAIGAPYKTVGSYTNAGVVFVFTSDGAVQEQELQMGTYGQSVPTLLVGFRGRLHVVGDQLVCSAPGRNKLSLFDGVIHYWTRSGTTWTEGTEIPTPAPAGATYFGYLLAFDGTRIMATHGSVNNATFFLTWNGSAWALEQTITIAKVNLAISGTIAAMSRIASGSNSLDIYEYSAGVWAVTATIDDLQYCVASVSFHQQLRISDSGYVAYGEYNNVGGGDGHINIYSKANGSWELLDVCTATYDGTAFGQYVEIADGSGEVYAVGASANSYSGSVDEEIFHDTVASTTTTTTRPTTTKFFSYLFAPGRHAALTEYSAHIARTSAANPYVLSTATTINTREDLALWPASGFAYTSQETLHYDSTSGASLVDCSRGLFPCTDLTAAATFATTYKIPDYSSSTTSAMGVEVATVPFSWMGRRIAIYAVAYDDALGTWRTQSGAGGSIDAELLWIGRINHVRYSGARGVWEVGCDHLLGDLDEGLGTGLPSNAQLYGINLLGPQGLTYRFELYREGELWPATGTIAAGMYYCALGSGVGSAELAKELEMSLNLARTNAGIYDIIFSVGYWGGRTQIVVRNCLSNNYSIRIVPESTSSATTSPVPCHAFIALGFTGRAIDFINIPAGGQVSTDSDEAPAVTYHPLNLKLNGGYLGATVLDGNDIDSLFAAAPLDFGTNRATLKIDGYHETTGADRASAFVRYTAGPTLAGFIGKVAPPAGPSIGRYTLAWEEIYQAQNFSPWAHACQRLDEEPAQLKNVYCPHYHSSTGAIHGPFAMLLWPLLSTGTTDANDATYDKLPLELSCGMDVSLVDTASFLLADALLVGDELAARHYYVMVDKPVSWLDLLKRECKLFGYILVWDAAQSKLSLRSAYMHDLAYTVTLGEGNNVDPEECPDADLSIDTVINRWEVQLSYDRAAGKYRGPTIIIEDEDSIQQLRTAKTVKLQHPGVLIESSVAGSVENLVGQLYRENRFCWRYPWYVVSRSLTPDLINRVSIGDIVRFQSRRLPDPYGGGVMQLDCAAYVLNVAWNLKAWTGTATLILFSQYNPFSQFLDNWTTATLTTATPPWAWSALTVSWNAGTLQLTVAALTWGSAGDYDDAAEAQAGDMLDIVERAPADPTSPQIWTGLELEKNYEADGANILTFAAGTALAGWDATKQYIVMPSAYQTAVADQRDENAYQADGTTCTFGASTVMHRWG